MILSPKKENLSVEIATIFLRSDDHLRTKTPIQKKNTLVFSEKLLYKNNN